MNFVPYAIPFFIFALAAEIVYARGKGVHTYRLNDTISSLAMGSLSQLRGVLQVGIGAVAFEAMVSGWTLFEITTANVWAWVIAFVLYDVCYYFSHRYGHEWRILWAAHVAHHQSEEFNLSTALRQTSTGLLNTVFYIPLYFIGFPAEMLISVGSLNLIYQFWVHTEHVRRLGWADYVFVTPSNHRVHHAKNPRYIDRNYGGVFILWDRLFGTFEDERDDDPCVYGITRQLNSWNPLWANAHVYTETFADMMQATRWRDRLLIWFRGPGWYPEGVSPAPSAWTAPKFDPESTPGKRIYALVQFAVHVPLVFVLLGSELPRDQVLTCAALLCFGFYAQGTLLEGRPYAWWIELTRAAFVAAVAVWMEVLLLGAYAAASAVAATVGLTARRAPADDRRQSPY